VFMRSAIVPISRAEVKLWRGNRELKPFKYKMRPPFSAHPEIE
jgi:hypothetical protein